MKDLWKETKDQLKRYGMVANKSLGQNFLIDSHMVNTIVEASCLTKEDLVIEIGPGLGTLTEELQKRAKRVLAIELDPRMITILTERFGRNTNVEILHQDVLKVDLKQKIQEKKQKYGIQQVKIVANLPYYITTPIIMKLLEEKLETESITVMVQKEVADRLCSMPGEKLSGAITYRVHYDATVEKIVDVPKESFLPEPEVESAVIQLIPRYTPPVVVKNENTLFQVIKVSFMQRRKTLANALLNGHMFSSKEEIYQMLETLGLDANTRGETLTLAQFADIANYIET